MKKLPTFSVVFMGQKPLLAAPDGFSIIELIVGVILFAVMAAGIGELLVSGLKQEQLDTESVLAMLAVNNEAERLLCDIRDNWSCNTTATVTTISGTISGNAANSPVPPYLFAICSNCQLEWQLTCDTSTNLWTGYVRVLDNSTQKVVAAVSPAFFQP